MSEPNSGVLAEKFIIPPFTILNAGSRRWMERKREWTSRAGMDSATGRDADLTYGIPNPDAQRLKDSFDSAIGRKSTWAEFVEANPDMENKKTSIFDPVLTELIVNWFSPRSGVVLDPFAGGIVRGAVSSMLGREYHGVDLSKKQIDANNDQWNEIVK